MKKVIYLDNAATTKVRPEVVEAMLPFYTEYYGNPSAVYEFSTPCKEALAKARETVANSLGAKDNEIYFTNGGSESDNWALIATAEAYASKGKHIITTKIEHHAILHTCEYLEKRGYEITYLPVDEYGTVSIDELKKAIRPDTILISVMFANNEIGTIQPIKEIGEIAHENGIIFHTDAVQAYCHEPINVDEYHIDMLSASGHKFHGPKGVGFLYIRKGLKLRSFIHGGAQERKRRAGTENVPGIVGLGKAVEIAMAELENNKKKETELRDYLIGLIKETYKTYGFCSIETPCVEHIENLCSKQGGDNEKLIFKILKRGEKLKIDTAKEENDLVDGGLRYDLTVPLARYYANHSNELPAPFKALQIGNVWRADRPQKGRFRQFMQCDIDILGEPGNLAEIELILATTAMLGKLSFQNFTVCINDRNILKAMAAYSGFREEDYDEVFIILDKMDKIGAEGVAKELEEMGYAKENVETYLQLFQDVAPDVTGIRFLKEKLGDCLSGETADSMEMIISSVETAKECEFNIKFNPTLVRGQSYYTGTIFEVTMDDFGGSVAGGGRYDKMIGKFTGQDTPACGFSIGFERIVMLLLENGYEVPTVKEKKAYLLEKKMTKEGLLKVMSLAKTDRQAGKQVLIVNMKKNKKFQKEQLAEDGYIEIVDCYADSVENL